ncbi:hypothetical protein DPV78_002151 [Talaromyces pinophilus]|nr:hypothetical protein DPV78_002151 [Talaromyces pinophilus]
MAPLPLRVGRTVGGNRMTITLSQRACSQKYHDYLKTLGDRFDEIQPCGNSLPQGTVFMSLRTKQEAIGWEQERILWKIDGQKEDDATTKTQLSLVSVWKVDEFQSKLGLPKHDIDDEQGIVVGVDVPRV